MNTVHIALNRFAATTVITPAVDADDCIPIDTAQATSLLAEPWWSGWFDGAIADFVSSRSTQTVELRAVEAAMVAKTPMVITVGESSSRHPKWKTEIARWLQRFQGRDAVVLYATYLPRIQESLMSLALRQLPTLSEIGSSPPHESFTYASTPNWSLRRKLVLERRPYVGSDVEDFLRQRLDILTPKIYVEGFERLLDYANALDLPTRPRQIVTANAFGTDEPFKAWVSEKIGQGTQYIVWQHGNNYGTHRWITPLVEQLTPDAFITWGWRGVNDRSVPGVANKRETRLRSKPGTTGKIVLVEDSESLHRRYAWENYPDYLNYFEDQLRFVSLLSPAPQREVLVRLHHEVSRFSFNEPIRWREAFPNVELDIWNQSPGSLFRSARLVVHSYESTSFLECLASNIPSLGFWSLGLNHLKDETRGAFEALVDAGIVIFSPEEAASVVNANWPNYSNWWRRKEIQEARRAFVQTYARTSPLTGIKIGHEIRKLRMR